MNRLPTFASFLMASGFKPTAAQTRMTSVAFDGAASPDDELGRALFGAAVDAGPHDVVAIVKGARIGGSLLSAYRLLHLALTVPLPTLAPGEHGFGLIVAPDLRLARQTLRYVIGALGASAFAGHLAAPPSSDALTINRPDGKHVTLECLPATRGGSAVRGRTLVGAVMSEASFFRDQDYAVNDAEVYRAIAPRIVEGGQLVAESTPWAEAGLLYDIFTDSYGKPGRTLAIHAPTLLMRPSPKMRAHVEAERKRDPDNAAREFDAAFMTAGSGLFFDPVALDACVDPTLEIGTARKGTAHAGADWAFESDSSALAIADATYGADGTTTHVAIIHLDELVPKRGEPLKTHDVVATFAASTKQYGGRTIMADAHYRVAIQEHLASHGLWLQDAPPGQPGKTETYVRLRELVNEKRLRLPTHDRLLAQLKAIVSKPVPGGGLKISSPRRGRGGHGDIASAVVLAVWQASGNDGAPDYAAVMRANPHGF